MYLNLSMVGATRPKCLSC